MHALSLILAVAATGLPLAPIDLQGQPQNPPTGPGGGRGQRQPGPAPAEATKPSEESFATAIKDFEKKSGVVDAYLKGETLMFALPKAVFGRDFMWYLELKQTPGGSYSGTEIGSALVRFEMRNDKVLVRQVSYRTRTRDTGAIKTAIEQSNVMPIIAAFDTRAVSADGTVLVDVSRMFRTGLPEIPMAGALGGSSFDQSRTFIDRVVAFPDNINVEVTATAAGGAGAAGGRGGGLFGGSPSRPSNTGVIHHSFAILPEEPMMGRLWDSRVGYFSNPFTLFDDSSEGTKALRYISRYRLEKKDPKAAMSEPVKPIVYTMAHEVPEKWRPYVRKGVEDWNVAFEEAGFKNAIRCDDPPKDPNWSPEDVRYSVIRWAPLPIRNAMGPHTADPRSGEILSAHIIMWHDVLKLCAEWYFTQASPNDPRAQRFPLPDDIVGEALRFVVAHEVGHTLGLPHNGKASAMVPTAWLRDPKWTKENGTAASIMDYARFNYVAQPGDGANLMPMVGPYDKFSIKWGYMPINGVYTSSDEKPVLDALAAQQVSNPLLRFYDNFSPTDPTAQSEALGDDAVIASTYGVQNLKRVMSYLVPATTKLGEDYSNLSTLYGEVWGQHGLYVSHVLTMVGGIVQTDYRGGRGSNVYSPVQRDRQRAAVLWLIDNVLKTPTYLIPNSVLTKIGSNGGASRVASAQRRVISGLLQDGRLGRMLDLEMMHGRVNSYTIDMMMADLRTGVWSELGNSVIDIDPYRRNLQRLYVNSLVSRLGSTSADARSYVLADLKLQQEAMRTSMGRSGNAITRQHLEDLSQIIEMAIKFPLPVAAAAAPAPSGFPFQLPIDDSGQENRACTLCHPRTED